MVSDADVCGGVEWIVYGLGLGVDGAHLSLLRKTILALMEKLSMWPRSQMVKMINVFFF